MSNVELIMVSFDENLEEATKWAKKESFPWPTVLSPQLEKIQLPEYKDIGVADYLLVDKNGKELARGKKAILKKLETLKK